MIKCYIIAFFCISIFPPTGAVAVTGPENGVFKRGSNVTLICSFDNDCNSVTWNYKDEPIYNYFLGFIKNFKQRSSIVNSTTLGLCTSQLTISDLKLNDSGTYSCGGRTSDENPFVKKADLVVVDFRDDNCSLPANKYVVENESMTITCEFSTSYNGSTQLQLTMESTDGYKNSSRILKSMRASVIAKPPEVPVYQCLLNVNFNNAPDNYARNTPQETRICKSADHVKVNFPVRNLKLDPNQTNYRSRTPILCKADGYPIPDIHWKRFPDGKVVANGSELVVDELSDIYTYQCYAENVVGGIHYSLNSTSIQVADNSTPPAMAGCSSACVGVIVGGCGAALIAGSVLIFFIYKKNKKNSYDKECSTRTKNQQEILPLTSETSTPFDSKPKDGKKRGSPDGGSEPVDPSSKDHQKGSTPVPAPRRAPMDPPPPAKPRRTPNNSVEGVPV